MISDLHQQKHEVLLFRQICFCVKSNNGIVLSLAVQILCPDILRFIHSVIFRLIQHPKHNCLSTIFVSVV